MDLNQLYCFMQTAKSQQLSHAANLLHISQPALSENLSQLEKDLGVTLFDRQGKELRLNEHGRVALRYTEQALRILDDMQSELAELTDAQAGHIRIGSAFPSMEPDFLHTAVRSFALERPDVRFSLIQYSARNLLFALESREIDIAVTSKPILKSTVLWSRLFTEKMGILLSVDHPLAEKKAVSILDLQQERFYCNNTNSDVYDLTYGYCMQAGFQPTIHFEGEFPSFIAEAISMGYGVSIISDNAYARMREGFPPEMEDKLTFRPLLEPYCQRTCGVARLSSRSTSSTAGVFYDHLLASCQAENKKLTLVK
jgi:DNA-binding transcriptional LysR family regulator